MQSLEAQVTALSDRLAVADLPVTYARGVDRRNWDLVRSCFTDDAEAVGSRSTGPIGPYLEDLRRGVELFPTTMHFMGNQLVALDGDRASVETYAVAYHWAAEQAGSPHDANLVVGVRYHDEMVRTDGGWRIRQRKVSPDWRQGNYPA